MIIEELIAISFVFTIMFGIVVSQVIALSRVFRSWSWYAVASGLTVLGIVRVYGLMKLPTAILKAKAVGAIPESLSVEQWIMTAVLFIAVGCLILGFDKLRRDLRRIGI